MIRSSKEELDHTIMIRSSNLKKYSIFPIDAGTHCSY
jgi:hypothetical protein